MHEGLAMLASGLPHAEVLKDFQDLTEQDMLAGVAYAAGRERKVKLLVA